jgi:hypothetical protein
MSWQFFCERSTAQRLRLEPAGVPADSLRGPPRLNGTQPEIIRLVTASAARSMSSKRARAARWVSFWALRRRSSTSAGDLDDGGVDVEAADGLGEAVVVGEGDDLAVLAGGLEDAGEAVHPGGVHGQRRGGAAEVDVVEGDVALEAELVPDAPGLMGKKEGVEAEGVVEEGGELVGLPRYGLGGGLLALVGVAEGLGGLGDGILVGGL